MANSAAPRRLDSDFTSGGTRCAGWLYLPEATTTRPPVVVMAHGFGAERTFRLPAFAARFVARGLAVFLFDYRGFGASDGEPRQWVSPRRHLEDWMAAVEHVKGLANVDPNRVGLWGSSFSGGHVLVVAARTPGITAVVSQVPLLDGLAVARTTSLAYQVEAALHALWDVTLSLLTGQPHRVPIVSSPERFAAMNRPDSRSGFLKLVPDGAAFDNRFLARGLVTSMLYRPIRSLGRVSCPVLVLLAERETLYDPMSARSSLEPYANVETVLLPAGHFEVYADAAFEQAVALEADFLAAHLEPTGEPT